MKPFLPLRCKPRFADAKNPQQIWERQKAIRIIFRFGKAFSYLRIYRSDETIALIHYFCRS